MANAIVGSGKSPVARGGHRRSRRLSRRRLPGRVRRQNLSIVVRYTADLLNGVPSIVIGIFAYALVVMPVKHSPPWPAGLPWA